MSIMAKLPGSPGEWRPWRPGTPCRRHPGTRCGRHLREDLPIRRCGRPSDDPGNL